MDAASHLPTTESDSAPEEFSLSEADFYDEIYARYRSENHRALSSENRFWMAQFAESVKGTTMKPFVFPLFQWRHLNTNDRVRSLPEEIQEMVVIELFFQNRYFGSRNKAKREFASVQSLLQSWNAFVTNIAKSGFDHVVSMMLRSKIRFYKLTLKGRKMNVHDLSRNEGHPCGVLASQACPVCFDTALKMDEATRKGLNPGVKISSTLRQAIARLDRDMQRHASAESDAEILSDSDTDILGDSDAEPDGEPMVLVQPLETKPAAPPPTKYVPAATATIKGLFNADRPAKLPASSPPPPPPPPSLHPPSRGRPSAMAYCRELEKKLTEEKLARLELERKVVEQNIELTRVHAICADLRDTIESLVTRLEVEGSLRMNRRRS